ncbi:hypothetical protein V0U79_12320 [Hyphobacterium sp. HN65]|uniref:Uncharacterized protein n=2 Tax=Hyphobacterium lacteum TaxID=3116575 RepID=A0ABU7LUD2_9PROT|nr:hypothetical protein [Hyphobacterium sp. HN65]
MTRMSSFSALPGAVVRAVSFLRQNVMAAMIVAILPGLAAVFLTYETGLVTSEAMAPDWTRYLIALVFWYFAMVMSQAAMFRLSLRGKPEGFFGLAVGGDELRLAASWALVFFLILVAAGIGLVIYAALMAAVSMVSMDTAGLTPENPVETGNIPDLAAYYGPVEWSIAIILGAFALVMLAGYAGRLLLAPAASMARRKVQALSVMAMTRKRGFAVALGCVLVFVPAGLLVHGFGVLSERLADVPVHQPARLFSDNGLVAGLPLYAVLAFLHGWLAAFLTLPVFAGLTTALYRAWGGDD